MSKQIESSYLYADGHAVIVYSKEDKDAGKVTFCEVHEKWTDATLNFEGRLFFGPYDQEFMTLAKRARGIKAQSPSIDHGSENTKRMGIAVGYLDFEMGEGYRNSLHWLTMPGVISSGFTYQPEIKESCPSPDAVFEEWGSHRIAKFHKAKVKDSIRIAA